MAEGKLQVASKASLTRTQRLYHSLENGLEKTDHYLASGAQVVVTALLAMMVAVIFLQVFCRYALNNPLNWAEESTLIFLVWMTFLGSVTVARKNQWIFIDVLLTVLPGRVLDHLAILSHAASILFYVVLIKEGLALAYAQKEMMTSALEISWGWIYLAVPLSSLLLLFHSFRATVTKLRENPFVLVSLLSAAVAISILATLLPSFRSSINFPSFLFMTMIFLFLIGMPVGIALGVTSMIFVLTKGDMLLTIFPQNMIGGVDSFPFLAVPFFILAGELMERGGVTVKLVQFASAIVGHIRGGLGHVAVVANLIMAGMSGSEVADAAATGSVLIPSMKQKGYHPAFAAGIIAAASVIGPIFPPSIPFVIYGALASTSVLRLFLGGVVPGVLMAFFLMGAVYLVARKAGYQREKKANLTSLLAVSKSSMLALFMPLIIIGGMLAGIFTPTEASNVAVIYALFLGVVVYRQTTLKDIVGAFSRIAVMTAGIMYIVATASIIGWIVAREQIPQQLMEFLLSFGKNPWAILTIVNLILLFLGCFISSIPITLIMIPMLIPVIRQLHIDPVHFGVVFTLNVMIGLNTPPFGMAMFIVCKIAQVSVIEFVRQWWPFFVALLLSLGVVTYVPAAVTWLPNLLLK